MDVNQDVIRGRWKQVSGRTRELRGKLSKSYREVVMGRLRRHVGALQERRGLLQARLDRARKHLLSRPGYALSRR